MKVVKRRVFYQTRMKADGSDYVLYTYEVVDDLGNKENVDTLQEYEKGDRVETWFDSQYSKVKMRTYKKTRTAVCDKCGKGYKLEDAIEHEFCNVKRV